VPLHETTCLWCGEPFPARTSGNQPKQFCSPPCRQAFHTAARRWAIAAVAAGLISVETLKRPVAPCTAHTAPLEAGQVER
jgi:hypothetical protein